MNTSAEASSKQEQNCTVSPGWESLIGTLRASSIMLTMIIVLLKLLYIWAGCAEMYPAKRLRLMVFFKDTHKGIECKQAATLTWWICGKEFSA